jgi:hypothetical protein
MPSDAPVRPPRAFFFEAIEGYCQLGLEPEIHFKVHLHRFSRKFPLEHAELLTYAAFDPTQSCNPWNRKLSAIGIIYGRRLREADVMKYFDDYDEIKVYPIPRDTEMSDQRIRDFFSQTELNTSSRPGLKIRRDYIGDSMPFERQMASPQPTKVIPQSTARVPPSDGRPESDRDSLERDHHDSNDECEDDSPANNAQLRKSQRDEAEERDNDDSNDDYDDDSPPDNALRDKAESAHASNFRSCAWMFAGEWSSLYDIKAEFQEVYLPRILFKVQQ